MLSYILLNTLIYGTIAFGLSACFAYAKYLNVTLGSFMILWTYALSNIIRHGLSRQSIAVLLGAVIFYLLINYVVVHFFSNERKRDLFWLIFTLWAAHLIANVNTLLYGANPISLQLGTIPLRVIAAIILLINILVFYVFRKTYIGAIRRGIYTNAASIRAIGINTFRMIQSFLLSYLPFLIGLGLLIANQSSLRPSDNLFYIIKGIGIMIMVWLDKREYVYAAALVYVILEYVLFIQLQLPIQYKEAFILAIILLILLFKPQGLLSTRMRNI